MIIGGGPGGYVAAIKAAQLGLKVSTQPISLFSLSLSFSFFVDTFNSFGVFLSNSGHLCWEAWCFGRNLFECRMYPIQSTSQHFSSLWNGETLVSKTWHYWFVSVTLNHRYELLILNVKISSSGAQNWYSHNDESESWRCERTHIRSWISLQ